MAVALSGPRLPRQEGCGKLLVSSNRRRRMKFGIFYELQCPRPWEQFTERDLYQNALAQVELEDKLGYHYAWEREHHFLEAYAHSPQPQWFLAAPSPRP